MDELPIIKIIKKGVAYDKYNDYKLGEVLEVSDQLANGLIEKKVAVKATTKELEEWQGKLLGEDLKRKAKGAKINTLRLLKIDNYIDNVKYFAEDQPFFYDKAGLFWFWNEIQSRYEQKDDVDVMNMLDNNLGFMGQTVSGGIKNNYLEAFKRIGRQKIPQKAPKKWVQFRDKAYSLNSGKLYDVRPNYFFCNPIPWEIGGCIDTPTIDKLFEEWVGVEYMDTLYEIIAYCCYTEYPIQLIFCLFGSGRNGKSCFMRLVTKFLGQDNICSTELDTLLDSRFESFKLYKRLMCSLGETNFGVLTKTSLLKKLVGGDTIGYEQKNKQPFDDYNYAKIIVSSNSLPSSQDTSEGFYRRWLIIDFPNQFPEGKDILKDIPEQEYNNLCKKVILILPKLLESGEFTNQGEPSERKWRYILSSNPLPIFLNLCCERKEDEFISYMELYVAYLKYLKAHKKRKVKTREFKSALEDEGHWVERTSKKVFDEFKTGYWIDGLALKDGWEGCFHDNYADLQEILTQSSIRGNKLKKATQSVQNAQKQTSPQETKVEEVK